MFDQIPTLKKFCCCISLRIGALILGFLDGFLYIAELSMIYYNVYDESEIKKDETFAIIMHYFSIGISFVGIFVIICLIFGAGLVSEYCL